MRDINLTKRNSDGGVKFNFDSNHINGMELLVQKVTIALLSSNAANIVQQIFGGELNSIPKFTLNPNDLSDFKASLNANITNIERSIKNNDAKRIAPFSEKLDTLSLLDLSVDLPNNLVNISLYVKNLAGDSTSLDLPVRV